MPRTAWALWMVLGCVAPTHAQDEPQHSEYARWIDTALQAAERGELAAARDAFERAHAIEPSARTLRGLGTVDFRAGRFAEAFVELSAALADRNKPLPEELAGAVRSLAARARAQVGLCELVGAGDGTRVTVDGRDALVDGEGRIVLPAGNHRLQLEAAGQEPLTFEIEPALGGAIERVHVRWRAVSPAPRTQGSPPPAPVQPAPPAPPAAPGTSREAGRVWTWVAAASIPVFAVAAGLSWKRMQEVGDAIAARCKRELCDETRRTALLEGSSLTTFETLTTVFLVSTGVAVAATGVAFVLEGASEQSPPELTLGPTGMWLRASF